MLDALTPPAGAEALRRYRLRHGDQAAHRRCPARSPLRVLRRRKDGDGTGTMEGLRGACARIMIEAHADTVAVATQSMGSVSPDVSR